MTDTAQPLAAETDPMAAAAEAFKVSLGQSDAPERPRDDKGRFASDVVEQEEEIEAEEAEPVEAAESEGDTDQEGEEAEEAQPEPVGMPSSWAKEDAEMWSALPPETQAKIAEREGQRDTAVNQKFQEAANVRRQNEAVIQEAVANRERFAQLADMAKSAFQPREPSLSMLDINSNDYDPDAYHLQRGQYEQQRQWLGQLETHQREAAQARERDEQAQELARFQEINAASRDGLLADVPELAERDKAQGIFSELMEYAMKAGAPADMFQTPTTALEWHMLWKAQQFDKMQSAKARVEKDPKPEPKKPQPALRPGVATPRSAVRQAKMTKDLKRLDSEGSIEAGAAVWKHYL